MIDEIEENLFYKKTIGEYKIFSKVGKFDRSVYIIVEGQSGHSMGHEFPSVAEASACVIHLMNIKRDNTYCA